MSTIDHKLQAVESTMNAACAAAKRPREAVQLLAVSKTFPAEAVLEAIAAGQLAFGENYLQEALDKIAAVAAAVPEARVEWHFIGPIQANKTRAIASHFDWVHSVDRAKIITRLNDQRPTELAPLNICLQVNINDEASKAGASQDEIAQLAELALQQPRLRLRGLMAIPANTTDNQQQRHNFAAVRSIFTDLQTQFPSAALDTLSMGMSGDMEAAIAEGATLVRIGSDIFGPRPSPSR